jgi:hypothetical protein
MNRLRWRLTRTLTVVGVAVGVFSFLGTAALAYDIYGSAPYYNWSPRQGYVQVVSMNDGTPGHAWAYQDFYWDTASRHSTLTYEWNGTSAYEHEIIFYNYDGNGYASGATTFNSNLPSTTYLDPGVFNNQNEYTIEIGTTRADLITHPTWYYADAYLSTRTTGSNSKIRTVRGARAHSCPWDWCVSEINGNLVNKSTVWWYSAPGSQQSWSDP